MTHTTVGGTGTVDQVGWAKLMAIATARFRVADATSWAPSVVTGVDRTVRLAVGSAEACGVQNTTDITYDLQCTANGTASDRYDLIVATWTWSLAGCAAAFSIIQGTAGAGVPAASVLTRNPGAVFQAVVLVVKVRPSVGTFSAGDLTDMRVWGGAAGPLVTPQATNLHLIDGLAGYELITLSSPLRYRHDGTVWQAQARGGRIITRPHTPVSRFIGAGLARESGVGDGPVIAAFTVPQACRVLVVATFRVGQNVVGTGAALIYLKVDGVIIGQGLGRSADETTMIHGVADVAAGSHAVALRVEAFGGDVTWDGSNVTLTEGAAE